MQTEQKRKRREENEEDKLKLNKTQKHKKSICRAGERCGGCSGWKKNYIEIYLDQEKKAPVRGGGGNPHTHTKRKKTKNTQTKP